MSIELVVVTLFLLGIVITAYLMRGGMLHKLKYLPGEVNIFEESKVKLQISWVGKPVLNPGCKIIVTNRGRIIVAQKPLFGEKYHLKYVVYIESYDVSRKKPWEGYINFYTPPENISYPVNEGWVTVKIFIPQAQNLFMKQDAVLLCDIKEAEKFKLAVNESRAG